VLTWRISNSMDASFRVDCLEEALIDYGKPDIFYTDQGSQFTSVAFTGVLKREGVDISMDGRGRALDNIFVERLWRNVKYEDVYLNGYATMGELHAGLTRYFAFYNGERPHQGLEYRTPNVVYESGKGGGAMIVDKYGSVPDPSSPEPVPALDAGSAGEHGAPPQTPPCREQSAMTATQADG
jgi:putative transposase